MKKLWLTNLLNVNDREIINSKDIFTKGVFSEKNENGKELLQRKLTGYVSYVRSENPYTFPLRIYAKNEDWNDEVLKFNNPKYQMNNKEITSPIQYLDKFLFYNNIGSYQKHVYDAFIKSYYDEDLKELNEGISKSFSILQKPLLSLNMTYPHIDYDFSEETKLSEKALSNMIGESGFDRIMKPVGKSFEYKSEILVNMVEYFPKENFINIVM